MEVKDVYQDNDGTWHIDYDSEHLVGLAIRVCVGEFMLGIYILLSLIIVAVFANLVSSNPIHQSDKITPNSNLVPQKCVCTESN